MLRLAFLISVVVLAWSVGAHAQGFVTTVRVDCLPNGSGVARVELFHNVLSLADERLSCANGSATTMDLLTGEEPNSWRIEGIGGNGSRFFCVQEAGTRFPVVYHCVASTTSGPEGFNLIGFRPRPAN